MTSSLAMDHAFLPRSIWTGDSKSLQQPVDLFTSVVVTRSIPAGTCFGPCLLQHTFYDTIAFIAQKSTDKRMKSYVFRVDPEAMRNSALVLSWLRLVQAARNAEEQNTEAFLKAGQLYVRTTRDIQEEEELLVWYDQELSHLLGFTDVTTRRSSEEYTCGRCNQVFQNEFPFLTHCRFLCTQINTWSRDAYERKHMEIKREHRVTDFHNIARDLEHRKPSEDPEMPPLKRKLEESPHLKSRKNVLLEKTNISYGDNITQQVRAQDSGVGLELDSTCKQKGEKIKTDHLGCKNDAARESKDAHAELGESSGVHASGSSAFSLVLSGQGEQKSAFCKPSKKTSLCGGPVRLSSVTSASSSGQDDMSDTFPPRSVSGYMSPSILNPDLHAVPPAVTVNGAFHYAPEHWSRTAPVQTNSALTILPPTFTSFGVSVQNWCAKCNLSFRMTSDLVFHMRSHHKKEFAAESQVRRRREEKLTCPICHEYFRERHHLSRHMTSHN
ncbi:PR domain zinc finger protein 8 [Synchiropus splendidus]|uniref:PR domain zinc finger protein 8 n=1 Tax=Synchiropus splendidus TaxID=270530 RepID=UPI00237DB126|nr:PR domain zinc finger protein 8 [Synchiropus splendidus]